MEIFGSLDHQVLGSYALLVQVSVYMELAEPIVMISARKIVGKPYRRVLFRGPSLSISQNTLPSFDRLSRCF
jgi:hypothetical protein